MATIAEFHVSAEDTALGESFERCPDLTCELERVVESAWPGVWLAGADDDEIAAALEADPTVEEFERVSGDDDRTLYELEFAEAVCSVVEMVLDEGGTLVSAKAENGRWAVRMRFRDREQLRTVYERLREHGVDVEIGHLSELTDSSWEEIGLTAQQYDSLVAAIRRGYFEIPRKVSMQELAEELEISHQALSERLRRAYGTLARAELDMPFELEPEADGEGSGEVAADRVEND
ncbi:helix-turn-helix domain-containing protein [Saliphagus sp. LR7]|uniref:helix-turn-helix domain-containing protein n=1 Tax=Saliphagus sp. LR7 TaxID=2282654 RepID=UPI000DF75565|nr:helix-turn-helix domain-containing protein [Saliphagus sp. LR7]